MADIWERIGGFRNAGDVPADRGLPSHQFWGLVRLVRGGALSKQQAMNVLTANGDYTFDAEETTTLSDLIDDTNIDPNDGETAALSRDVGWITLNQMKNFLGVQGG